MQKAVKVNNFYEYWVELNARYHDDLALKDDYNNEEYTFHKAFSAIKKFAVGLASLGLEKGNHVALFSENSARWLIADQALLIAGMVDAVRGSGATVSELDYILGQSDSVALIVENVSLLQKLKESSSKNNIKFAVYLSKEKFTGDYPCPVYSFDDIVALCAERTFIPCDVSSDDLATLIYTSGTTGFPKGVMLSQGNLLSQVRNLHPTISLKQGGKALSILPIWHSYERALEYYLLSCGGQIVYTNLKNFKTDMGKYQPHYFVSVPRIWESVYDGIQKHLATLPKIKQYFVNSVLATSIVYKRAKRTVFNAEQKHFDCDIWQKSVSGALMAVLLPVHLVGKALVYPKIKKGISPNFTLGISGGGAFQRHLEEFFDAIGMSVLNGYGLTESSPVIGVRAVKGLVLGSIGQPIVETQVKLIDPETKKDSTGNKGVLCIKGPQVMQGYYKNSDATQSTISPDGWLNTGDLVHIAPDGSIIITGRAKDTIVLSNGENIEPQGIEDVCLRSPFIKQIVLVGQDKPSLGALVVPDYDNIKARGEIDGSVAQLIQHEVKTLVQSRENYRPFERISSVRIINEEFSLVNGLMTQTAKIKRNKVFEKYIDIIEDMFS